MRKISGQTNVSSYRFGSGSIKGIGNEIGRFVVATMDIPWKVTQNLLGGTPEEVVFIDSVDQSVLDSKLLKLPPCDTVVGIGGGQAVDAAKYFSWKRSIRLVTIPTVISVDAFVTPAAGVRVNHEIEYVGQTSPDPLIIDYDIIRTAPATLNIAGIGDLLSIHTASFDWEYAQSKNQSKYPFSTSAIKDARGIIDDLYEIIPDIRDVTDKGILAIVQGYMKLNTICLPINHYRVEEGSEHFLFYELEERLRRPFIHGHIIGLGIYLMSRLQENKAEEITKIMDDVRLDYQPKSMDLKYDDLFKSLINLKSFVKSRPKLWFTVIDDEEISEDWISEVLSNLSF